MRQNMLWAGAVAHHGIGLIKIHKMLSLVPAPDFDTEHPHYDWSRLDTAMDLLKENGFTHLFELEGNPSGYFTDWKDDTRLRAWRRLIRDLALHYIDRYGAEEVERWYFATQNEPEDWKPESFNNYFDACSEGLKAANPRLRFGGPGTYVTLSPVLLALLRHCDTGTNYFTGEQGVRLDFINVHEKGVKSMHGAETNWEPNTAVILSRTMQLLDHIRREHPRFQHLPFMNGEADPKAGWYISRPYYSTAYYPAIIAKITNQQLRVLGDSEHVDVRVALQCNAFLGGWDYRSLLTLFQANHHSEGIDFHHDNGLGFDMVKKPVLNFYSMLSLLGDKRVRTDGDNDPTADLGALATIRVDDQVAVLLYNCADDPGKSGTTRVHLQLERLPFGQAMLVRYEIDDLHKQPYLLWKEMGSPQEPSAAQLAATRACQELRATAEPALVKAAGGTLSLDFDLPLPGVTLVVLSKRPAAPPAKVEGVRLERCTGLHGEKEAMVMWKPLPSPVVRTYEVLYAPPGSRRFRRINASDQLDTAFLHSKADGGSYKVRAVDYWGRTGSDSGPVSDDAPVLRLDPRWPHYFQQPDGKPVVLIGDYTWGIFTDTDYDYQALFDRYKADGLNFARVWLWRGCEEFPPPKYKPGFEPYSIRHVEPFLRPGPGIANDGRPKYDLTRLNPAFFDRVRDVCAAARRRGLFLQLMTMDAWMIKHPQLWRLHAMQRDNNINGVDADPKSTGKGTDGQQGFCSMGNPKALAFQKTYLRKLVETVNGFDNILIEIANENSYCAQWERELCEFVRDLERTKPRQHVLMPLDLLSHGYVVQTWDPPHIHAALLAKQVLRKPLIFDTDWTINPKDDEIRRAMWTALVSGAHFDYMDDSLDEYRTRPLPDKRAALHRQISYLAAFARPLKLWEMRPDGAPVKAGYAFALASTNGLAAYLPHGGTVTLDLAKMNGALQARWFNPRSGSFSAPLDVAGGRAHEFKALDDNDWALLATGRP
jgi:L-iduronidase